MKIKNKTLSLPLIQGGMGVGISLGNLAGHVAACNAMGVISTADIGFRESDYWTNPEEANVRSLQKEIKKAKELAGGLGLIGINAMVATTNYALMIKTAIKAGIDCIICGAGLPLDLPSLVKGSDVAIAPIVSSGKAAKTICHAWDKRYSKQPDFVVIEGPEAGGHLGFKEASLLDHSAPSLDTILPDVLTALAPYKEKYKTTIPVFVAGGIYTSDDVTHYMNLGADGVQVATRFIGTYECDASEAYKQVYIDSKQEDIAIVKSPVGMPGRAIKTPLIKRLEEYKQLPIKRCINCLHPCKPATTPYCITNALIRAAQGDYENGLHFCGSNAWKINKLVHVKELINDIMKDWRNSV